jgi:hypothetical protein
VNRFMQLFSVSACVMVLLLASASVVQADTLVLSENFTSFSRGTWSEGSTHGDLFVDFTGLGRVSIVGMGTNRLIELKPMASSSASETHAALVTTTSSWGDIDTHATMITVQQLRTNDAPNAWEVAWFVWHFTDNDHFYYFALKPNGWELGKRDPAYPGGQRFLATGGTPTLAIGGSTIVRVRQEGNAIGIYLNNGPQLIYFEDLETPYLSGAVGFYTEDARVRFDSLSVYTIP